MKRVKSQKSKQFYLLRNVTKNRGYSALIFLLDFWRPAHSRRGQNFDYNTLPALLSRKKLRKYCTKNYPEISAIFFEIMLAFLGGVWYYNIVKRKGNKKSSKKKKIKNLLTKHFKCVIMNTRNEDNSFWNLGSDTWQRLAPTESESTKKNKEKKSKKFLTK